MWYLCIIILAPLPVRTARLGQVFSYISIWEATYTQLQINFQSQIELLKNDGLAFGYLGLKQERFMIPLPNDLPDYQIDTVNGQQMKRVKVNRPMAFCFDYLQLKDTSA